MRERASEKEKRLAGQLLDLFPSLYLFMARNKILKGVGGIHSMTSCHTRTIFSLAETTIPRSVSSS